MILTINTVFVLGTADRGPYFLLSCTVPSMLVIDRHEEGPAEVDNVSILPGFVEQDVFQAHPSVANALGVHVLFKDDRRYNKGATMNQSVCIKA